MAEKTNIEWPHHTFNPWWGCDKVHEGCAHCYAETLSKRTGRAQWGPGGTRVKTSEAYWRGPLKWNREAEAAGERRRVFCASMADVFEDWSGEIRDHEGGEWLPSLQDGARTEDGQTVNCSDQPDRVGKKSAGRSLDGREWSEFPSRTGATVLNVKGPAARG